MMSDRFDWQTEEEEWVGASPVGHQKNHRSRLRWLIIPLILLGMILAGMLVFLQLRHRIHEAEAARKADVLSSYQLIRDAISQKDGELFRAMLSGRDLEWAMSQQTLFSRGLINDQRPFGLNSFSEELESIDVELESSLQSADVIVEHRYVVAAGDDGSEVIRLRKDLVFRQGDRWLWSPPGTEYWGGNNDESVTGRYLTLFYPKRDEDFARRLFQDLDDLVSRWCDLESRINCPEILYLQVRLSRDPASLSDLANRFYRSGYTGDNLLFNGRAYYLTMPAPSLVGIPSDENSYQALLKGYGVNVLGALAARTMTQDCCVNEEMFQAVIRSQLDALKLFPWSNFSFSKPSATSPLPEMNVRLLCKGNFNRLSSVYDYNIAENTWKKELSNRPIMEIKEMPAGNGMLVMELDEEDEGVWIRIILRQDDTELVLFDDLLEEDEGQNMVWRLQDQDRRLLVEVPDLRQGVSTYYSYDLLNCSQNACIPEVHHLLSAPTWSPDGRQLLVRQYGMIWRQQGLQVTPLADGVSPFWIDDETFGFVRQLGDEQVVILRRRTTEEIARTLNTRSLIQRIPEETRPEKLVIGHISVVPDDTNEWIILAFGLSEEENVGEAFLFHVDRATDEIFLALTSEKLYSFNLSTESKKLAATLYDAELLNWKLKIYDFSTRSTTGIDLVDQMYSEFPPDYHWSSDGEWILLMNQGIVSFIEPRDNTYFSILPPESGCTQAIWTRE